MEIAGKSWTGPRGRWRVAFLLGLMMATSLCAASITGLSRKIVDRRNQNQREKNNCQSASTAITNLGKFFAIEAYTLVSMMVLEHDLAPFLVDPAPRVPFLVPGPVSSELQQERLARLAREFEQTPVTAEWYPTVRHDERAAFEAYAGAVHGGPINITDFEGADFTTGAAPPRATYNPLLFVWKCSVADAEDLNFSSASPLEQLIGLDKQERSRRALPPALHARFFEERRLIAHPMYLPSGVPSKDRSLNILVPFVDEGCEDRGDCFYDERATVLGYVSFSLRSDMGSSIFPENVEVAGGATGVGVIKTVAAGYDMHVNAYEPFLDLNLHCYYHVPGGTEPLLLYLGTAASIFLFLVLLWLLRRLELRTYREQRADQERRRDERIQDRFEVSEKTERYLNHELKNRILILGASCAEQSQQAQIDEIIEVLSSKAVLMRLSTSRYIPSWGAIEPVKLIDARWKRFVAANSPFERTPTTGAAANRTALRLDKALFNICLDNMLSNGFKYGDASRPPVLSLNVEPLEGATRVHLSLELRNWAGPEHEALLEMGEEELNEIALTEGRRAHEHAAELSSGDGFPMAAAAASALGGTVRLVLLPDGVVAKLELPEIAAVLTPVAAAAAPVELSRLKIAMVDDSASFRKIFARLASKVTSREPILAGATGESIDDFPRMVVEGDIDFVFLDFNFAPVHHTKTGDDLCRECRQLDAEAGNAPRLIFIVSANDSPEDAERYRAAGADGSLGKQLTVDKLRQVLEDAVRAHPRFAVLRSRVASRLASPRLASRDVAASELAVSADAQRGLRAARAWPASTAATKAWAAK